MSDDLDAHVLRRDINANTASIAKLSAIVLGNGNRGMDEVTRDTEKVAKETQEAVKALTTAFDEYKLCQEQKEKAELEAALALKEKEQEEEKNRSKEKKISKELIWYGAAVSNLFLIIASILAWFYKIAPALEKFGG